MTGPEYGGSKNHFSSILFPVAVSSNVGAGTGGTGTNHVLVTIIITIIIQEWNAHHMDVWLGQC